MEGADLPAAPPTEPSAPVRPQPWHTATDFFCSSCRYDVSQTLADKITTCPECGRPVSRESCFQVQRTLSRLARAGLAILWMSPLISVPIVGGIMAAVTGIYWVLCLLLVYAFMIGLCYVGWMWVERWVLPHGAPRRAVFRTVVVVLIQLVSAAIILGVLYWAAMR